MNEVGVSEHARVMHQTMRPIEIGVMYHEQQRNAEQEVPGSIFSDGSIHPRVLPERCHKREVTNDGKNYCCQYRVADLPPVIVCTRETCLYLLVLPFIAKDDIEYEVAQKG